VCLHQRQEQLPDAVGEDEPPAPLVLEALLGERQRRGPARFERDHRHAEGTVQRLGVPDRQPVECAADLLDQHRGVPLE
jgi:hypothetical protein